MRAADLSRAGMLAPHGILPTCYILGSSGTKTLTRPVSFAATQTSAATMNDGRVSFLKKRPGCPRAPLSPGSFGFGKGTTSQAAEKRLELVIRAFSQTKIQQLTRVFSAQKAMTLLPWFIFPQPVKSCPSRFNIVILSAAKDLLLIAPRQPVALNTVRAAGPSCYLFTFRKPRNLGRPVMQHWPHWKIQRRPRRRMSPSRRGAS
jgi:hypothetical protein